MTPRLLPGALVVLEGLDKTGKTTQRDNLERLRWADPPPIVAHMPSGLAETSARIYHLLEEYETTSPLARQLLHLACHAESLPTLRAARSERGVILDRWWWSTIAYGLHGVPRVEIDDGVFLATISAVWAAFDADVVFLFGTPHSEDPHNAPTISDAYRELASETPDIVVDVPRQDPEETTDFILDELARRRLLSRS